MARRKTPAKHETARRHANPWVIASALACLDLLVFWPVRTFQLVNWDDPSYITENPHVLGGLSWPNVRWALTTGHSPYWHPVTWLSHLADVSLFGTDAGWYHVTNLVLHVANTVILFVVLRRMTRADWPSAFVAAIFGVHPLHVESVAWIAERKDVLSTFFWGVTLAAYVRYAERPSLDRYALVTASYILALASKPMVVTLPAILLLLDVWPLRRTPLRLTTRTPQDAGVRFAPRSWGRLILEKAPLALLAAVTSVATVIVQHRVGAMARFDVLPWTARVSGALAGYVVYLRQAVWPAHLAAFYPAHPVSVLQVSLAAAVLVSATVLTVARIREWPFAFVGWWWFLITLAPVSGLLQAGEQAHADRFMYVPLIGLSIVAAWGVPILVRRITPGPLALLPAGAAIVVAISGAVAHAQVQSWSDSVALWTHGAAAVPDSYIAYENLGQALRERGDYGGALASYQRALALAPAHSPAYAAVIENAMGIVLERSGRIAEAAPHFGRAVALDPSFAEPHGNLGNALASDGRFDEAISQFETAVRLKPDFVEAHVGLGGALLSEGRGADAIPHYRAALQLNPGLAEAHNGLGAALAAAGHEADAMGEYAEALRLKPDLPSAHLNIAVLLLKQGDTTGARRHVERALEIDPTYSPAKELESLIPHRSSSNP